MNSQTIVIADVDHIQEYVFGAGQLRAVRGSSALIEMLGEVMKTIVETNDGDCLRHQGGQLVAQFQDLPDSKCMEINGQLHNATKEIGGPSLTLTIGHSSNADFSSALQEAFADIRSKKQQNTVRNGWPDSLPSGGHLRHCELCKQNPAIFNQENDKPNFKFAEGDPGEFKYLCESCAKRIEVRIENIPFEQSLRKALREREMSALRSCHNIENLWPDRGERNYLAMVSADGNGIGSLHDSIDDPDSYRKFSQALDDLGRDAIVHAIRQDERLYRFLTKTEFAPNRETRFRMMPIISGGDDFTVLMPAEFAFDFALAWAESFKELSRKNEHIQSAITSFFSRKLKRAKLYFQEPSPGNPSPLTLAIGIAVAKPHFPISAFNRLSRQLRRSAKRAESIRPDAHEFSGIDFAVITTPNAEDLETLRERYGSHNRPELTARPYTLSDFRCLLALRAALAENIPQSKRKWLYAEFWRGKENATHALRFALQRNDPASSDRKPGPVASALEELACSAKNPFIELKGKLKSSKSGQTPLPDALEIVDFSPES